MPELGAPKFPQNHNEMNYLANISLMRLRDKYHDKFPTDTASFVNLLSELDSGSELWTEISSTLGEETFVKLRNFADKK